MTKTRPEHVKNGCARLELLKGEKELTRRSDELARRRQELPLSPVLCVVTQRKEDTTP